MTINIVRDVFSGHGVCWHSYRSSICLVCMITMTTRRVVATTAITTVSTMLLLLLHLLFIIIYYGFCSDGFSLEVIFRNCVAGLPFTTCLFFNFLNIGMHDACFFATEQFSCIIVSILFVWLSCSVDGTAVVSRKNHSKLLLDCLPKVCITKNT